VEDENEWGLEANLEETSPCVTLQLLRSYQRVHREINACLQLPDLSTGTERAALACEYSKPEMGAW
jgi:hypothetical protein